MLFRCLGAILFFISWFIKISHGLTLNETATGLEENCLSFRIKTMFSVSYEFHRKRSYVLQFVARHKNNTKHFYEKSELRSLASKITRFLISVNKWLYALKFTFLTVWSEAMKLCNKIISSFQKFADKYDLQRYPSRRKMGHSRVARVPKEKFGWENV